MIERTHGAFHPNLASSHDNLAIDLFESGEVSVGLDHHRQAVIVCEVPAEARHPGCSFYRQKLALDLNHSGRAAEAYNLLERNAGVQHQLGRRTQPSEVWTPTIQSQLWQSTGHVDEALETAREGWRETSEDSTAAPYVKTTRGSYSPRLSSRRVMFRPRGLTSNELSCSCPKAASIHLLAILAPSEHSVARDSVYRWIELRALPAHKVGRLWKFKPSEVDDWVLAGGAADSADECVFRRC